MPQDSVIDTFSIKKQLLEAGAHFGHQTSRWHPRMKEYIFTQRNHIHIIDLEKTVLALVEACRFVSDTASQGKIVLFVGTKKQAQEPVEQEARRCGMPFVTQRWIGGMLTNFAAIQSRVDYLVSLEDRKSRGEFSFLSKKETLKLEKTIQKMNRQMGGFKEMTTLPGALFIIDLSREMVAVAEARRAGIPIVAIVDTNCSPDGIDYPIPANDDAVRAIRLVCSSIADAVLEGVAIKDGTGGGGELVGEGEEIPEVLTFAPEEAEDLTHMEAEQADADYNSNGERAEGENGGGGDGLQERPSEG